MNATARARTLSLAPPPPREGGERGVVRDAPAVDATLRAAMRGEQAQMEAIALRILPRVRNAVRYLVRGDAIDDLVQDVLVTVLERLHTYAGTGRFEAWVDGVVLRVVLGRMRKQRAAERRSAPLGIDGVADESHGRAGHKYATSRQLVRALDELSDNQRSALVMHHVFGLTVPEIASELAVPHETVRTRLRDGMGQLRALLRVNGTGVK